MGKEKGQTEDKPRLVKMHISAEDHDRLKIAAILGHQSVSEYCRDVVMARVREVTKNVPIAGKSTKSGG